MNKFIIKMLMNVIITLSLICNLDSQIYSPSLDYSSQFLYFSRSFALSKDVALSGFGNVRYKDFYAIGFAKYGSDPDLASDSGDSFTNLLNEKVTKALYSEELQKIYFVCEDTEHKKHYTIDLNNGNVTIDKNVNDSDYMPISAFFDKYSKKFAQRKIKGF